MVKNKISAIVCVLILALGLSSCPNAANWAGSDVPRQYFVDVNPKPANGNIILSSSFEAQGKGIQVYILPAPGFVYKAGSLGFRNRSSANQSLRTISQVQGSYYYQFSLTGAHTEVTAEFVSNAAENGEFGADPAKNTISIDNGIDNGFIVPNSSLAAPGSTVTLNIFPADGYVVDTGSFKVFEVIGGELSPASIAVSQGMPHTFTTPFSGRDVLVKAEFVPAGFKEIAETAGNYLKNGRYDIAARLYEAAYKKRSEAQTNAELDLLDEVIFYHAIGKLGNILIEGRVRGLLGSGKNNLNLNSVPSTLDDWMCDIASGWPGTDERYWYEFYRGIDYNQNNAANENRLGYERGDPPLWRPSTEQTGDVILPKISSYSGFDRMDTSGQGSGFPGDFGNSPLMNQTEKGRQKYWHVYFMLMLCQTRDEGLNLLLEKMDDL
jgi:predicted small secreted protein